MKKTIVAAILGMMVFAANAMAYVPDLFFHLNINQAAYNASTEILQITALADEVLFTEGGSGTAITPPNTATFTAKFASIDGSGIWRFTGINDADITINGSVTNGSVSYDSPLLLASIDSLWFNPFVPAYSQPAIGGTYTVTGGSLYNEDSKGRISVALNGFQSVPTDSEHCWKSSNGSGDVSPVPEPASMLLLGSGLLGFLGLKKRKSTM